MEQTDVSWLIGNPVFGVVAGILLTALGGYGTLVGKMVLVRGSMIAAWTIVVLSFAFYPVNAPPMHRFVIGALVGFMWGAILVWVDYFATRSSNVTVVEKNVIPEGYALVKKESNIVSMHFKFKTIDVHENESGVIIEGWQKNGFKALVIPFVNTSETGAFRKSGLTIGPSGEIGVEMSFICFDTSTPVKVHPGVWLNEDHAKIIFGEEQEKLAVTLTLGEDGVNAVERQITSAFPNGRTCRKPLTGDLIGVRVRLLNSNTRSSQYMIILKNGLVTALEEAEHWRLMRLMRLQLQAQEWVGDLYRTHQAPYVDKIRSWESKCIWVLKQFVGDEAANAFRECDPKLEDCLHGLSVEDSSLPPEQPSEESAESSELNIFKDKKFTPESKPDRELMFYSNVNLKLMGYLDRHREILEKHRQSPMPLF